MVCTETEFVVNYLIGGISPLYLNQIGLSDESYEDMMSLSLDMESEGTAYVANACPVCLPERPYG